MSFRQRKWAWVLTDEEKINITASIVCAVTIVTLIVFSYVGDVPREVPVTLTIAANLYLLRSASREGSQYVDTGLACFFFISTVVLNLIQS
jgi:hypothetical protein